jgi:hypothetical protein
MVDSCPLPWDAALSWTGRAVMDSTLEAPPLMLMALLLMSVVLLVLVCITTLRRP